MFKSAATKIAHNSTIPSLALSGNKDLRPLQDLITAEKVVLITLQKLSVDFAKAGEALRIWGTGEGEDLGDTLTASTTILAHFSAALSGYAAREHSIRDHLKAIRTREEALDELKRRRKATLARADSAEKKLSKMGPEHKNLAAQTDILNGLQAQIRQMDGEIMTEEASLGDFKRSSARSLMGLKFGGLMEVCEKGSVVAECGRGVAMEIPVETTTPGLPRAMYSGHMRTQERVNEAERCVNEIVFQALPAGGPLRDSQTAGGGETGSIGSGGGLMAGGGGLTAVGLHNTGVSGRSVDPSVGGSGFLPPPEVGGGSFMESAAGGVSPGGYAPPGGMPPSGYAAPGGVSPGGYAPPTGLPPGAGPPGDYGGYSAMGGTYSTMSGVGGTDTADAQQTRDDIGMGVGVGGTESGPGGGRFATFPVRGRGFSRSGDDAAAGTGQSASSFSQPGGTAPLGVSPGESTAPSSYMGGTNTAPPSLGFVARRENSEDLMSAVMDAGEFGTRSGGSGSMFSQQGQGSTLAPSQGTSSPLYQSQSSQFSSMSTKQQEREQERQQHLQEEPAPEYRDVDPTSHAQVYDYANASVSGGVPPGPPPGAAPPVVGGIWMENNDSRGADGYEQHGSNGLAVDEGGGDRTSKASEDIGLAYMSMDDHPETEREREARISRHVRFGPEEAYSEPPTPDSPYVARQRSSSSTSATTRGRRVPPPKIDTIEDERALNVAAAREVARELDMLNFSPPPIAPPQLQEQQERDEGSQFAASAPAPKRDFGSPPRGREYTQSPPSQYATPAPYASPSLPDKESPMSPHREPSPLVPPAPPFSRTHSGPPQDVNVPSPVQPAPHVAGHHATPSWALRPESPGSPTSPRLDAPYRAPIANRSTSSLDTRPPPGARTISAAAFRRPQKAPSSEVADTSPLAPKKRLPASPYPQQRAAPPAIPPVHVHDEEFDYIDAYSRDSQAFLNDGSPMQPDFDYGRLGRVEVVGGPPVSPGYAEGRFATDPNANDIR